MSEEKMVDSSVSDADIVSETSVSSDVSIVDAWNDDNLLIPGTSGLNFDNKIKHYMDEDLVEKYCQMCSWSVCDGTTINVRRGPNYVSGQKAPSKEAIYDVICMDAYKVPKKIHDITQFVNVGKFVNQYKTKYYDKKLYPLPGILIINIMVPDYSPSLSNVNNYDGPGYQVIIYAKLSDHVREMLSKKDLSVLVYICYILKNGNIYMEIIYTFLFIGILPSSINLLSTFMHTNFEENTKMRDRFKCIGRVMNLKYTGFNYFTSKILKTYNSKPFLTTTCCTFYHKPGKYFKIDLNAHEFGYLAKKVWNIIKSIMTNVIYDLAFVIQAETNDELPEQLLCCCRISKFGAHKAKKLPTKYVDLYDKCTDINNTLSQIKKIENINNEMNNKYNTNKPTINDDDNKE